MSKVQVNEDQCKAIGKILQTLAIRPSAYEREYITFEADPETKLRAYLFSVGICHQTHTLINKRLNLVGFNYLEKVFVDLAKANSELLDPAFVARQSKGSLASRLGMLFSDTGVANGSTLDRLEERAGLLIDMSVKLAENYSGRISTLLATSDGHLSGADGIYKHIGDFEAYSDPFMKKSSLFVTLAKEAGLLRIKDIDNLVPIMDYHIQRVLLRSGCIEVVDLNLRQALINKEPVESDEELRFASIEAVKRLAVHAGHHATVIHDFFWPLGRSCCKEKPLCKSGVCDKSPCTFELFVNLPSHKKCVFAGTCKGSLSEDYIKLWQPLVETQFY